MFVFFVNGTLGILLQGARMLYLVNNVSGTDVLPFLILRSRNGGSCAVTDILTVTITLSVSQKSCFMEKGGLCRRPSEESPFCRDNCQYRKPFILGYVLSAVL